MNTRTVATAPEPVDAGTVGRSRPRPRLTRERFTSFARERWGLLVTLALLGWFLVTGLLGADYGEHWDEPLVLDLVNHTITTKSFLPNSFYDWPSVTYSLSVLAMAPRVLARLGTGPLLTGDEFFVTTRSVFVIVTALGGLWLYLAGRRLMNEIAGVAAAAAYLLSFELAYHARWIAPDGVTAQFVALFLLAAVVAAERPDSAWRVHLPAAAAAAGAATKYSPAVLLAPALVLAMRGPGLDWAKRAGRAAISVAVFVGVFVALVPGTLFQTGEFIEDVRWQSRHQRTGHSDFYGSVHGGQIHDLKDGFLSYLGRLLDYLVLSVPSPFVTVSLALTLVAGVGMVALWRRDRVLAACLTLTFGALLLYTSTVKVFIVRNFLGFLPFYALLVGCGAAFLFRVVKVRAIALAAMALIAALFVANGLYLWSAARSITEDDLSRPVRLVDEYIEDHPDDEFVLSPEVRRSFRDDGRAIPENARARQPSPDDEYVFWYSQVEAISQTLTVWPTTKRDFYRDFGSLEVNFDYYPTWPGPDRIIVMTRDELRDVGLTPRELGF